MAPLLDDAQATPVGHGSTAAAAAASGTVTVLLPRSLLLMLSSAMQGKAILGESPLPPFSWHRCCASGRHVTLGVPIAVAAAPCPANAAIGASTPPICAQLHSLFPLLQHLVSPPYPTPPQVLCSVAFHSPPQPQTCCCLIAPVCLQQRQRLPPPPAAARSLALSRAAQVPDAPRV